jgi:uncharacterized transporter YbjL
MLKKKLKSVWEYLIKWYKQDPDEKAEEEEFGEFLEKVEKRMDRIKAAQKAETHEARAQVALMFENAYTQRKIAEANKKLQIATWILAFATIALVVGDVYGSSELSRTFQVALQFILGILVIGLALGVIRGIWKFIKWVLKK